MDILELLPFLGILLLQFVYQIYKAYKKKQTVKKNKNQVENEESGYISPLDATDEYFEVNEKNISNQSDQDPNANSNSSLNSFSILEELFGKKLDTSSESTDINKSHQNREHVASEEHFTKTPSAKPKYNDIVNDQTLATKKNIISAKPISSTAKTTPALELFKKMRSKQNFKDYWKVKFILDEPVGNRGEFQGLNNHAITSLGRTNRIQFNPSKSINSEAKSSTQKSNPKS